MNRRYTGMLAVLAIAIAVGCSKKAEKYERQFDDAGAKIGEFSPAKSTASPDGKKVDDAEKPTWLRPPQEGGKLPDRTSTTGEQPWVGNPPVVPGGQATPVPAGNPATVPPPKSGGATPPTTPQPPGGTAVRKPVTKADMNEVWIFMENASIVGGKLPPPELVIAALIKTKAAAAELVKSGDIILTGATRRESIWAYEYKTPTQGGWIASQNGPEEITAAEFARRIRE